MITKTIDTEAWSSRYRDEAIDVPGRRVLVTNYIGTEQEPDLSEPPNCKGFGRIRHFHRRRSSRWMANPLPIDPACRALSLGDAATLRAQVFQNAVCNWRCWYCFVPFNLLNANKRHAAFMTPGDLLDLYLDDPQPPPMIDLTGGQPDLTPEWVPWMMEELQRRDLTERVYLWSDDNLSNDYFWRYVSDDQRAMMTAYRNYGRVACFKGIDRTSFAFNTGADASLFDEQFELFRRFAELGLDMYAYTTFTTPDLEGARSALSSFVDRLQRIHPLLPLRTVPLEVAVFTPVQSRMNSRCEAAMEHQYTVASYWEEELTRRFLPSELSKDICDLDMRS
jgi:uncharacterized Fe-S cluster-containing radical SAM superfamily protein